ncbi:hypothetical protein CPB83DRAFT_907492 [Crepidotus variabilis]|uniref:Uncharacterized protein n=1 Tax=Crepidotus variabilis TaxID=179855 RepID=A0A9P6EER4_9AGAR|nr:hypothetical protein CPB83DRAFT_907492 [Crepidotus variabilis]
MNFLAIEYPITRTIHWKRVTVLSYVGAFVLIIFLTILNVALVGYETINVFQNNYNATQELWFHGFLPYGKPKLGTLCDPYLLTIGDHFRVQGSELDWTISSIKANGQNSGLAYTATSVSSAYDVTQIIVNARFEPGRFTYHSPSEEILVILECNNLDGISLNASTQLLEKTLHLKALSTILTPMNFTDSKSSLYELLNHSWVVSGFDSKTLMSIPGGKIEATYFCKHQHLKESGSLFVSALLAVLSMFYTIWAVYMWIISTLAKRSLGANTCLTHGGALYQSVDLETAVVAWDSREEEAK